VATVLLHQPCHCPTHWRWQGLIVSATWATLTCYFILKLWVLSKDLLLVTWSKWTSSPAQQTITAGSQRPSIMDWSAWSWRRLCMCYRWTILPYTSTIAGLPCLVILPYTSTIAGLPCLVVLPYTSTIAGLPCLVVFGMPRFAQHEIGTLLKIARTMSVVWWCYEYS